MVLKPTVCAKLLREKIKKFNSVCWLINTGWLKGPFGVGERISISYSREAIKFALEGKLKEEDFYEDPVFGFKLPKNL